jgi:hypothetical protein
LEDSRPSAIKDASLRSKCKDTHLPRFVFYPRPGLVLKRQQHHTQPLARPRFRLLCPQGLFVNVPSTQSMTLSTPTASTTALNPHRSLSTRHIRISSGTHTRRAMPCRKTQIPVAHVDSAPWRAVWWVDAATTSTGAQLPSQLSVSCDVTPLPDTSKISAKEGGEGSDMLRRL